MKWRKGSDQGHDEATSIELTHSSGSVRLDSPRVVVSDEGTEIRGVVDAGTWQRVRDYDIFGATSRVQSVGRVAEGVPVRIVVITNQELPTVSVAVPSEAFSITEAMYQIDPAELRAAGLEGEIWEGVTFTSPRPWSSAIAQLEQDGFERFEGLPSAETVRRDSDGISVEFRHHDGAELVQVQAVFTLPQGESVPPVVFEVVNGVNAALPFSTTMVDAGDLIIRDTVPDALGDGAPSLISSRASDLVQLLEIVREPLLRAASGELTAQAALEAMFS